MFVCCKGGAWSWSPGPGEATIKCLLFAPEHPPVCGRWGGGSSSVGALGMPFPPDLPRESDPSLDPTAPTFPSFPERVGGRQELWALPTLPTLHFPLPCPIFTQAS